MKGIHYHSFNFFFLFFFNFIFPTDPQLCLPVKSNNATPRIKPEEVNLAMFKHIHFQNNCNVWQSEVLVCQYECVVHCSDFAFNHSADEKRNETTWCVVLDWKI